MENNLLQKWSEYFDNHSSTLKNEHWSRIRCCKQLKAWERTKESNQWFHRLRFVWKEKKLLPRCVTPITIELKMEIPWGYFGIVYPRSSLLKNYFVSCNAGVIDSDFRGAVLILMTNNGKDPILIKAVQRTAQIVFHKKEEVVF